MFFYAVKRCLCDSAGCLHFCLYQPNVDLIYHLRCAFHSDFLPVFYYG